MTRVAWRATARASAAAVVAALSAAVAVVAAPAAVHAQTIAQRVAAVRDGTVQMTFPARPDVCGDGTGRTWTRRDARDGGHPGWDRRPCVTGPIRVTIGRAGGETVSIRDCAVCRAAPSPVATDLGAVSPDEAARYLLAVARTMGGGNADDAVAAAALADAGDLTPAFVALVRDADATLVARKQALFWLGQTAESTSDVVALDGALTGAALREQFAFVLSQRRDDPALDKLMEMARRDPDMAVRKQAIFWLGQSREPRAIQFFRDVLRP